MRVKLDSITAALHKADNYDVVSGLFIKLLALIYFAAFLSLAVQITGLVGVNGILPFNELLDYLYQNNGPIAWLYKPTVFWFDSSDMALQGVAITGCVVSLLLFLGIKPMWSLIVLYLLYLSLFHAGQIFLLFQWDTLLLEAGFLAIFLTRGPSHLLLFMFHWLLFRLRFMSGVSKFASGDPVWANLTTLDYYFETQPLPHIGSWYFHQLPEWVLHGGVVLVLFSELIVPFFMFLPRRFRLFAAGTTVFVQLLIIATSNHNWINLLTIVLCLFLLDDDILKKFLPRWLCRYVSLKVEVAEADLDKEDTSRAAENRQKRISKSDYVLPVFALLILFSSVTVFTAKMTKLDIPQALITSTSLVRLWGIGHIFHVFPTMQTERHELEIEGSDDGVTWKTYEFKYKPGKLDKAPAFIVPYQPRLDWMIWFVPPQSREMMYWFDHFLTRLEQGSPEVLDLLAHNPFPEKPPRYLRVQVYQYWFTTAEERAATGNWWKREYLGQFPYVRPRMP
jgi:lipase maturation factor 1